MNYELTDVDIKKIEDEIEYRIEILRPKLMEELKTARGFGDLSENFEYRSAKSEKNRNESRIRYLQRILSSAKIINVDDSKDDEIGLFDKIKILTDDDPEPQQIKIVTTLRQNPLLGLISKESPVGKALLGHKVGDKVHIVVSDTYEYDIKVVSLEKGEDDESMDINRY